MTSPNRAHADVHDDHDDHGGLARDLPGLVTRRRALLVLGGMGLAGVAAACSDSSSSTSSSASSSSSSSVPSSSTSSSVSPSTDATTVPTSDAAGSTTTAAASGPATTAAAVDGVAATAGEPIPEETAGPFPADGSNGPNVLQEAGVVRADLTASIGSMTGTADGVPMAIQLTVVDAADGSPLPGAAVYLWHCTADGRYSIYEVEDQNYLRGVQVADAAGRVTFTSIFPGCYAGRWPHCHFEVYASVEAATSASAAVATSQLALPQAECEAVYADDRYGSSASNLSRLSLTTDGVFRDGWADQLAVTSGSRDAGFTAALLVRV